MASPAILISVPALALAFLSTAGIAEAFAPPIAPSPPCGSGRRAASRCRVGDRPHPYPPLRRRGYGSATSLLASGGEGGGSGRKSNNPLQTIMSDFASAILPTGGGGGSLSPEALARIRAPVEEYSWENIRSRLPPSESTEFRDNLKLGYGPSSPLHDVRLYDPSNKEQDIRVTFYRDSASWCPYCQKIWMALEAKRIPYRVERINMRCYGDKPRDFLRMQPSGQIPVAVIDGKTYGQSNDILAALEALFPDAAATLSPRGDIERTRAESLYRLERRLFGAWMYWLTGGSGGDMDRCRAAFVDVLSEVERSLGEANRSGGEGFFLGDRFTLVDVQFAPFLERMCASLLFYKGFQIRVASGASTPYPNVNRWFDAMERLEAYQVTKSDYYTHCWDLPPQLGGCTYESGGEPYERAINGERSVDDPTRGSWELPLRKDNGGVEPDWAFAGDEEAARREAVERVTANHDRVVRFAARGAGRKGLPPFSAALADPNATPNETVVPAVDALMRCVCMALLNGSEEMSEEIEKVANAILREGKSVSDDVVKSISYLRDRVGVPRDMRLPAARQLRAHLNWALGYIVNA